jgi:hypothetical protein
MSNQVVPLGYANTFGDWIVTSNKTLAETNDIGANNYIKDSGTFTINSSGTGLLVKNDAIVQGIFTVAGTGSSATVQNDLTVGRQLYLTNTSTSLLANGTANILGNTIVGAMIMASHGSGSNGISFLGGTTGDTATIKYYTTTGDARKLHIQVTNDPSDDIYLDASGTVVIPNSRDSTSVYTGALVVAGGIGVGGDMNVGGTLKVNPTAAIELGGFVNVSNSMFVSNNVEIGKALTVGGNTILKGTLTTYGQAFFSNTDQSTSAATGAIVTAGGIGVAKNITVDGIIQPNSGSSYGISFKPNPGGGTGDTATIKYYAVSGEQTVLELAVNNDADDTINLSSTGPVNVTNTGANAFRVAGGASVGGNFSVTGTSAFTGAATFSSTVKTGALTVDSISLSDPATTPAISTASGGTGLKSFTQYGVMYATSTSALATGTALAFNGTNLTCAGNITAYSDARLKKNIKIIENALEKVKELNGYTFERTDIDVGRQTGVIAQEVMHVLPEAVSFTEDGKYTVSYGNMVGLLIESIKELNSQVTSLKEEIEKLKNPS